MLEVPFGELMLGCHTPGDPRNDEWKHITFTRSFEAVEPPKGRLPPFSLLF